MSTADDVAHAARYVRSTATRGLLGILLLVAASLQLRCGGARWIVRCPTDVPIRAGTGTSRADCDDVIGRTTTGSIIAIPAGTKGRVVDRKFLEDGSLVSAYPASANDLQRDGAIEILLFEVTDGPRRGSKGWVRQSFLPRFQVSVAVSCWSGSRGLESRRPRSLAATTGDVAHGALCAFDGRALGRSRH
jgi:hypothetical protein